MKATIVKALGGEKYIVRLGDDREEVLNYDQIIQTMNQKSEDGQQYWAFKEMIGHSKFKKEKGCEEWQIRVKWKNNEESWETVYIMKKDDSLSLGQHTYDNNLTKTNYMKWKFRTFIKKLPKSSLG